MMIRMGSELWSEPFHRPGVGEQAAIINKQGSDPYPRRKRWKNRALLDSVFNRNVSRPSRREDPSLSARLNFGERSVEHTPTLLIQIGIYQLIERNISTQ